MILLLKNHMQRISNTNNRKTAAKFTNRMNPSELATLKKLKTPVQIQDFLDTLKTNFEETGDGLMSPRRVLRTRKAHCIEAALLAALALSFHGRKPLLMDLQADSTDHDHVVALYKEKGFWGAVSKSNHASLRFRDPVYKTLRELALSYFHEYFNNKTKKKTLISYSQPFNLKKYGVQWITAEDDLWDIAADLDDSPHYALVSKSQKKMLRPADTMELRAGQLVEWLHP
jgi:hypothetical protein